MARLRFGEKEQVGASLETLLNRHQLGLSEQEISEMTGMDRRRLNNYLRELEENRKAYREKRLWFPDR